MNHFDEPQVSKRSIAMKYGLYGALTLIIFDLILYLTGLKSITEPNPIQYMAFLIFIAVIVIAIKAYVDSNGYMTLGQGFLTGLLTAIVCAIIVSIYAYIFMTFIAPDMIETMREFYKDQALESGTSEAQYEQAAQYVNMFTSPAAMALTGVIIYGLISLPISLITSLVLRRE